MMGKNTTTELKTSCVFTAGYQQHFDFVAFGEPKGVKNDSKNHKGFGSMNHKKWGTEKGTAKEQYL